MPVPKLKDKSLSTALTSALSDGELTYNETIDLVASCFDAGGITAVEQDGLRAILKTYSDSLSERSIYLLTTLLDQLYDLTSKGPKRTGVLKMSGRAGFLVCDFLKRNSRSKFPNIWRNDVGIGLLLRLMQPGLIDQASSSLCGPSALLYNLALDQPVTYVKYAIDLFEKGHANIGKMTIEPSHDCRHSQPGDVPAVDWMTAASLRDSENWFFDYESTKDEFAGITLPSEIEDWFTAAGFSDVQNDTNLVLSKNESVIGNINDRFNKGYRVCLLVGDNMLSTNHTQKATATANHWIVLRSAISLVNGNVSATVFTWGKSEFSIPRANAGSLSKTDFLKNLYGYVAAKP